MEIKDEELEPLKYIPILSRCHNRNIKIIVPERFVFKKTITLEKPKINYIEEIYLQKSPQPKRKPQVLKPYERNHNLSICEPVLGNQPLKHPRSASVIPKRKNKTSFNKYSELFLPILSAPKKSRIP